MRKLSALGVMAVVMLGIGLAVFSYLIFLHPAPRSTDTDPDLVIEANTPTAPPVSPSPPAPYSRIVFVSDQDGSSEIYTMEPDGSDLLRLTVNHAYEISPKWSPDGTRIAWFSYDGDQTDLYVMNADGSNVIRLTDTRKSEYQLRWSPDSSRIAFGADGGAEGANLFVMPSSGGEPRLITDKLGGEFAWSPDGTQIAFAMAMGGMRMSLIVQNIETHGTVARWDRGVAGQLAWSPVNSMIAYIVNTSTVNYLTTDIHLFDLVSGEPRDFIEAETNINLLQWSPQGNYLAYARVQPDALQSKLYVVDASGHDATFLADFFDSMGIFDWSPDEAHIVYASAASDTEPTSIYIADRNQPNAEPESIIRGMSPDWSPPLPQSIAHLPSLTPAPPTATPTPIPTMTPAPAGMQTRIVFYSTRDGNPEIYTMKPDGSDVIRLTQSDESDIMPKWSPDGTHIAWMVWDGNQGADLYVMNADGTNPIRLTNSPGYEFDFEWSRDGQWIAYTTVGEGFGQHLYIVSAGGGEPVLVDPGYVGEFHWSPDSRSLAFNPFRGTSLQVYILATASTQPLLEGGEQAGSFAWSPDGTRLAVSFMKPQQEDGTALHLIDLATDARTTLVDDGRWIGDLHWSPDGQFLAYVASPWMSSRNEIEVDIVPAQGGTPVRAMYFPYPSVQTVLPFTFHWSADSAHLVFSSEADQFPNSYVMVVRRDGSELHPITDANSSNQMPDWSPYLPVDMP